MPELIVPPDEYLHIGILPTPPVLEIIDAPAQTNTHQSEPTSLSTANFSNCVSLALNPEMPPASPPSTTATCAVCMDNRTDIALYPCSHTHCCFSCFRQAARRFCPICRTAVKSVMLLSSRLHLPVSLVCVDRPINSVRRSTVPRPPNSPVHLRQSMPLLRPSERDEDLDNTFFERSRATSMPSTSVARQAESSLRPLSRSQNAVFRQLRESGSVQIEGNGGACNYQEIVPPPSNSTAGVATSANVEANLLVNGQSQNVVLIGHSKRLLMSLAQRLMLTFPPPTDRKFPRSKSTAYINGEAVRLVLVVCQTFSITSELVARVQRQSPKLVLLCADFFNLSSFESIVRLDMEMLDYLYTTCVWVLVKSSSVKRPKKTIIVDNADVLNAKHFLSTQRRCFIAQVDGPLYSGTMRKLGIYMRSFVRESSSSGSLPVLQENVQPVSPRPLSLFCLRPYNSSQKRQRNTRRSMSNLSRRLPLMHCQK